MFAGSFAAAEKAGGFDDDINFEVFPGQGGRVFFLDEFDFFPVYAEGVFVFHFDVGVEDTVNGVVFYEVGHGV